MASAADGAGNREGDRVVVLGRVAGAFGVAGWVKIRSYTDPPDNILKYPVWQLGRPGSWTELTLEGGRVTAKGILAKLAGIDSPEQARERTGAEVGVWRSHLPPLAPGEYYWSDLEGAEAYSPGGERLGRIDHFRNAPGGTIVVVHGEREHWIPFVKERVLEVDLDAGRVVFDWEADW